VPPLYTLRTDGGARGNPGPGGAGFVIEDENGAVVRRGGRFLGSVTNNQAEYEALIWGLETALDHGVTRLRVCADSELVVRQMNGIYRVKNEGLKPLFSRAQALVRKLGSAEIVHVRREMNAAADELANIAMDGRSTVGDGVEADDPSQSPLF
jgi:ribonuclease HI